MNLESFDPKDTSSIIIITYRNKKRKLRMDRRKKTVKTKMFLMAKKKREVIFQLVGSTSKFLVNCSSFAGIKKKKKKKNIYIYIYMRTT